MSLLDVYRQKLEAHIQEHKAQLDLLKARARKVAAQSKIVGYEELAQAEKHLDQAKARFKELKGAGGHAFADIKTGMKKALSDLKVSTKKAAKHFESHASRKASSKPAAAKPSTSAKTRKH